MMWNRAELIPVPPKDRRRLQRLVRNGNTPQKIVLRSRIVLGAAQGQSNNALAKALGTTRPTVLLWRRRYREAGVEGLLQDAPRPGRRRRIGDQKVAAIVNATLRTTPPDATHWSVRTMARVHKVSPATVQRIWKAHGLQPHEPKPLS